MQADDARDVIRALGYAHRSLLVDSMFLPARFNLALTLEKLWLIGEAREVWDGYVVRDGSSGWSAEADRRRTRLATVLRADRTASTDLMLAGHVDLAWSLAAPGSGIRAGIHQLTIRWKLEVVTP